MLVYWEKDAEYGAARPEEKRKTKEEVYDVVREDMQVAGETEEDVEDRKRWR